MSNFSPAASPKSLDILSFVVAAQLMMEDPNKKKAISTMISPTSPPTFTDLNSNSSNSPQKRKGSHNYQPYPKQKKSSVNLSETTPYKCSVPDCDKGFLTIEALNHHLTKHSEERPYICSFEGCTRAFTQLGNLKTHERKHTGIVRDAFSF